jgi:CheY-like chemotaxis protein
METAMKKILFIDDDVITLLSGTSILEEGGYSVDRIRSIAQADDLLEDGSIKSYDCLIIDMNMSNDYIDDDDLKGKTHGGIFTGWVWLYNIAKPIFDKYQKSPKVIVYSQYMRELEEEMESASDEERNYYNGVKTITKAEMVQNPGLLLKIVDELLLLNEVKRKK